MKKPASIFTRVLLASLLPFALVFALICVAVSNVVYRYNQRYVEGSVSFFAQHASEKITDNIDYISSLLHLTSTNMADFAGDSDPSREAVLDILHAFMNSNAEIFCAWFVFKEGAMSSDPGWYARSFLRRDGVIEEIAAVKELDDPKISPWHYYPYHTREPYFDLLDYWNYNIGEGFRYTGTTAYPILRNGEIIGTVGMDILYENAFKFMDKWQEEGHRRVMLVAEQGFVVRSTGDGLADDVNVLDLGFENDDRRDLAASLAHGQPLLREMRSPIFHCTSVVNVHPIPIADTEHRLSLYVDVPISQLYADMNRLLTILAFLSALGLIVVAVAVYLTVGGVVGPIRRLTHYAEGIANGTLEIDPEEIVVGGRSDGEVKVLEGSLKKMLEQMQQNHELKLNGVKTDMERKKAEDAAHARTQFFATMSHELRTPMSAIAGIADILVDETMAERHKSYIRDIKSSSESLLVIIDDILDISRLEAGKLRLVHVHFNLWRTLGNVASLTEYLVRDKKLRFKLVRETSVPHHVFADEVRLRQILINLLGNAVKYTPTGSVTLRAHVARGELAFDVIDTGVGIREEDMPDLFKSFSQVDMARNRFIKGAGLGLSITMNLASLMGGRVEVESAYGRGSVFKVRLPLVLGDATRVVPNEEKQESDTAIHTESRILVVDDNDINLRVAEGLLKKFGLTCETASSGKEALLKVQSSVYDLVFMDHMMPEMDGAETTRAIRELGGRNARLTIVAFTANSVGGVRSALMDAGMNDYLSKPIRKGELEKILTRWLPNATLGRDDNVSMHD